MKDQLKAFWKRIKRYFADYGGWRAVFGSPLFLLSILIAAIGYNKWLTGDWFEVAQSLLPNLLGFSLGTYAILFSLMTGRLKAALKAVVNDNGVPFLNEVNATFFHFIFVQVIALVWALLYDGTLLSDILTRTSLDENVARVAFEVLAAAGGFVGYFLLLYSISLVVASALVIYRLASIVDPKSS